MSKIQAKAHIDNQLLTDISSLIEESKINVYQVVNSRITLLYWQVGKRILNDVLLNDRAEYGKKIVVTLSRQLIETYGKGWDEKNLRRMLQFAQAFPDESIVVTLSRQLTWSHFNALIPLKEPLQRAFYAEMCRIEQWSVRMLRQKIEGMLFERTAISKKPEVLIEQELKQLRETNQVTSNIVFKDPYILDFLGLKNTYSELDLENAILNEIEYFLLELGNGFSFIERQKRIIIDNEDFYLDLLFYHRKLKCLIAIELKLGKFKAAYKSQMELYLRWLEKYEMQPGEEPPIGLILCAEGNNEQIELLQLDKAGIKVAEYLTALPSKEQLRQKLHTAIETSKLNTKV